MAKIRFYKRYSDASDRVRHETQGLGLIGGFMRQAAVQNNPQCSIATENGRVIGWATATQRRRKRRTAINIMVAPEHRRRGIGKRLLNNLLNRARRTKDVFIWPQDKRSERFYQHCGLLDTGK